MVPTFSPENPKAPHRLVSVTPISCPICKQEFLPSYHQSWVNQRLKRQIFCSKQCRSHARKSLLPPKRPCAYCSSEFQPPKWEKRRCPTQFCSKECVNRARTKIKIEGITCEGCQKHFMPNRSSVAAQINKRGRPIRYCSRACYASTIRKYANLEIKCSSCGETFITRGRWREDKQRQFLDRSRCKNCIQLRKRAKAIGYYNGFPVYLERRKGYPVVYWLGNGKAGNYSVHRLVMDDHLRKTRGFGLQPGEVVHHKNGDKQDWRLENLELRTIRTHPPGQALADVTNDLRSMRKRIASLELENFELHRQLGRLGPTPSPISQANGRDVFPNYGS